MGTMRPAPLPSAVSHGLWVGLTVASAPFSVTNPRRYALPTPLRYVIAARRSGLERDLIVGTQRPPGT